MPFLDGFKLEPLPKNWHEETVAWREAYFPEMPEVLDVPTWSGFSREAPLPQVTTVCATPDAFAGFASKVVGAPPATSNLSNRVWKAADLDDNRFNTALKIIRAQASTELGSIQQHRMVYEKLDSGSLTGLDREIVEGIPRTQPGGHTLESISFSKKRVCVEELRHHYQMAGVLTLDEGWDEPRWGRHWATEILEELFAMKPGEHVLDAFNIEFKSLLDTSTFLALIDRVGKYQLEMQHHFLYAPMALSMPYMRWLEESYHLAAGERLLKAIAVAGALDGGNFGLEDVQRSLNMWSPRGLEMFGSELGGAAVKGLFKTLGNDEAQRIYLDEVAGKVRDINLAVVAAKLKAPREEAKRALARLEAGERVDGMGPEDLLRPPHRPVFPVPGRPGGPGYNPPRGGVSGGGVRLFPSDLKREV